MKKFTITYTIKYCLDFAPEYVWNNHNECFNLKTGRRIKQVTNNGCIGYTIKGKFMSLKYLRTHLKK